MPSQGRGRIRFGIPGILLALSLVLFSAGCSSTESEFSAQDVNFAELMIPHHEQAIEMSELAPSRSSNEEVLALATEIKDAQSPEIVEMSGWPGVNPSTHAGHTMEGMLSESEMSELRAASGVDFDRLFLKGMIKHHQGAVLMAEEVRDSSNDRVAQLAHSIIKAQEGEITLMEELLSRL